MRLPPPYDDTHVVATAESGRKSVIRIGSLNLPSIDEETTPEIADNVKTQLAKLVEEFGSYAVRSALDKIAPHDNYLSFGPRVETDRD